jgi:DNA-binding protein HU-beta
MNKAHLIDAVAAVHYNDSRRAAAEAVDAVLDTITRALANGEPVSVTGFGRFETVEQAERLARNPQTGKAVHIAARTRPRFRPGQNLLDRSTAPSPCRRAAPSPRPKRAA